MALIRRADAETALHRTVSLDLGDALNAGLMVGNVPLIGGNARPLGELPGTFVIACIIGGGLHSHILERDADCLANASGASGYDRHSRHDSLS